MSSTLHPGNKGSIFCSIVLAPEYKVTCITRRNAGHYDTHRLRASNNVQTTHEHDGQIVIAARWTSSLHLRGWPLGIGPTTENNFEKHNACHASSVLLAWAHSSNWSKGTEHLKLARVCCTESCCSCKNNGLLVWPGGGWCLRVHECLCVAFVRMRRPPTSYRY